MSSLAPVGPTILNVNDNDASRYSVNRMLATAGFGIVEAHTGAEALELARRIAPRLIILDVKLPDLNGMEVCRKLKADPRTAWIKVLHTSAVFVAAEFKVQSLESGADGYLTHPFEPEELIATARSLLRLTEAEQSLRKIAEDLREANERIHQFLAMLSHELRNPLSAIASSLSLLARYEPRDPTEASARAVFTRQTNNLRRMVDDLLDVARVTQGKIEPQWEQVDLARLLKRVADTARSTRIEGREQQLDLQLAETSMIVRGDPLRLEQVFTNVLDNASKYTPRGGRVEMKAEPLDAVHVRVAVRDTGAGIAPEYLTKVFELFEQADVPLARSSGGLGVGLTLVRSLVELHGGRVHAHSEGQGRGTEVEIILPLLSSLPHPNAQGTDTSSIHNTSQRRILIVEDNIDAQQTLKLLLEAWGHEVHVASDGGAGLEAVLRLQPDLALIDIGLPKIDGYEVARRIAAAHMARAPLLVALTGYGDPDQRDAALRSGFDVHLVKPADPQQLLEILQRAGQTRTREFI